MVLRCSLALHGTRGEAFEYSSGVIVGVSRDYPAAHRAWCLSNSMEDRECRMALCCASYTKGRRPVVLTQRTPSSCTKEGRWVEARVEPPVLRERIVKGPAITCQTTDMLSTVAHENFKGPRCHDLWGGQVCGRRSSSCIFVMQSMTALLLQSVTALFFSRSSLKVTANAV
jgi:hypothetical protein